jgi:hypothetical protein
MADFVTMIPSGGWRALLELKDGSTRDVPLVGWCLSENDIAVPFFYPGGGMSAVELSGSSTGWNPEWGIAGYRLYHPEDRTRDAPPAGSPVVHLMLTDRDDPEWDSSVFTRCCGVNWEALAASGMITSRRDLVTCPGRPKGTGEQARQ